MTCATAAGAANVDTQKISKATLCIWKEMCRQLRRTIGALRQLDGQLRGARIQSTCARLFAVQTLLRFFAERLTRPTRIQKSSRRAQLDARRPTSTTTTTAATERTTDRSAPVNQFGAGSDMIVTLLELVWFARDVAAACCVVVVVVLC